MATHVRKTDRRFITPMESHHVVTLLKAHFDKENSRYHDGWNDVRVAQETGALVSSVGGVRVRFFGRLRAVQDVLPVVKAHWNGTGYAEGWNDQRIANEMLCSASHVCNVRMRAGLSLRRSRGAEVDLEERIDRALLTMADYHREAREQISKDVRELTELQTLVSDDVDKLKVHFKQLVHIVAQLAPKDMMRAMVEAIDKCYPETPPRKPQA